FQLPDREVQVSFNGGGIFVGVNAEITKMAALAAKRDMQINAQRGSRRWRPVQSRGHVAGMLGFPKGKRRVIRNEVVADGGFLLHRDASRGGLCWCLYHAIEPISSHSPDEFARYERN